MVDTASIAPKEWGDGIAFIADILGERMFHCQILEYQVVGMMGVVRVST